MTRVVNIHEACGEIDKNCVCENGPRLHTKFQLEDLRAEATKLREKVARLEERDRMKPQ